MTPAGRRRGAAARADHRARRHGRLRRRDLGLAPAALRPRLRSAERGLDRPGRRRPGVRRAARRAAAGLVRPVGRADRGCDFRFKNLVFAGETVRCSGHGHRGRRTALVDRRLPRSTSSAPTARVARRGRACRRGGAAAMSDAASRSSAPPSATSGSPGGRSSGLQTQAVTRALADAGLTLADVDGLATTGISRFSATQLADYLGLAAVLDRLDLRRRRARSRCTSPARPRRSRPASARRVVISFASNQRSARSRARSAASSSRTRPEAQFEAPYGPLYPVSYYAMAAQAVPAPLRRHAASELAEVAVAAREWALLNPAAFRHGAGPLTRRRRARRADGLHAADRGRLLPGHRRRRRGRADLARAGPRPAAAAGAGARLRRVARPTPR